MNDSHGNWLNYMNSQINFYNNKNITKRTDDEFFWTWYNSAKTNNYLAKFKSVVKKLIKYNPGHQWFNSKSDLLFNTRQILEDEYSKLQFDLYVLLKIVGHNKFFFPRNYFYDFISIISEEEFTFDLPKDCSGFPLKKYAVKIADSSKCYSQVNVITYEAMIMLTNKWRQYFIKRNNVNMIPSKGDIVFDCGSCIGDTSIIFAACVGNQGEVHLFDPIPLHNLYSQIQADLNPLLKNVLHINQQAVGETEIIIAGELGDVSKITPGGCVTNDFALTTIDNYCLKHNIQNVNYIKMDIEGAESEALRGASAIIGNCKPRLAIVAYHKEDDLWEIPSLIKKLNPEYKVYFEHHLPIYWESCFYAV